MFHHPIAFLKFIYLLTIFLLISTLNVALAQEDVKVYIADFNENDLRITMEENASGFLTMINQAFEAKDSTIEQSPYFTDDFLESFADLWSGTPFYISESSIIESAAKLTNGRYEMRNIPAYFISPDGEQNYEELVIQFTPSGLISECRIALAAHRFQEIMGAGEDEIDQANRETILTFVENFRTAYNKKDIDYIKNVFSDQALIIVGRVVENTGESSSYEQQVEYLRLNKDEYVDRLEELFTRNEWIDVGYEDIGIIRHPKHPDIYGVSLTQYYNSATYSDEGYLFLLIDFENPDEPMIHVRTWQPKQVTPEDKVFHIGYMEIF